MTKAFEFESVEFGNVYEDRFLDNKNININSMNPKEYIIDYAKTQTKLTYVVVEKNKMPKGVACAICTYKAKPGEVVLWRSIEQVGHIVLHKDCMIKKIAEMPISQFEAAPAKLDEYLEQLKEE